MDLGGSLFALLQDQPVEYRLEEIFSFQMKYPPSKCLQIRSDWMNDYPESNNELTTDTISAIANKYWSYAVALALTTIWRSRVDQIYNSSQITPTTNERQARLETRIQAGFDLIASTFTLSHQKHGEWMAAMETRKLLRERPTCIQPNLTDTQLPVNIYVGFFDGGSRGNPGPGGCGSIILEMGSSRTPRIVWINIISLAGAGCTNSVAEFRGLFSLLHFIVLRRLKPAHVVGDSQLIVRMMRERQRPKSRHLQYWYDRSRALADAARIDSWHHHFRCHNKMADRFANLAMDSRRSQEDEPMSDEQVDRRYPGVRQLLMNDINHWRDSDDGRPSVRTSSRPLLQRCNKQSS